MQRQAGLDLIRCTALLFVVIFHAFLNNGYYYQPQVGGFMLLAGSVRWLSTGCIGLFLLLTGYLKSTETDIRSCWRRLPEVLLAYFLAAAVSIPVRHYILRDTQSFGTWMLRLFGFSGVYYGWYVEMYVGLVLLMPFVNRILSNLQDRDLLPFAAVLLFLTALPGIIKIPVLPDYWRNSYPLTYYVLGAWIRRLQPRVHPLLGIGGALAIALLLGSATVLSTDGPLGEAVTWEFADLWILLIAALLFISLYQMQLSISAEKLLAFAAKGCYGGYLLSHLLDAWCYLLIPQWRTPARYPMLFLVVTVPVYLVSILCGRALEQLTAKLLRKERKQCVQK